MKRIRTIREAQRFIDRVGFCLLFPVKGLRLPTLYDAVMGGRPFSLSTWNDEIDRMWTWKDALPRQRRAFYGKFFRGKGTLISLEMLPYFYALTDNPGLNHEYELLFERGKITMEEKKICEALYRHGPMGVMALRHDIGLVSRAQNVRFKKAAESLQKHLRIVHFGTEQESSAWASGVYELFPRAFPKAVRAARKISKDRARHQILKKYFSILPHARLADAARVFGFSKAQMQQDLPEAILSSHR